METPVYYSLAEVQQTYTITTQATGFQSQRTALSIRSLYDLIEKYGVERIGFAVYSSGDAPAANSITPEEWIGTLKRRIGGSDG